MFEQKKSDYRQMYNAVYHAIKKDKQSARPLIEQYSKEISSIEGPPTQMEVMLELKINTEAFKSVAKVQGKQFFILIILLIFYAPTEIEGGTFRFVCLNFFLILWQM